MLQPFLVQKDMKFPLGMPSGSIQDHSPQAYGAETRLRETETPLILCNKPLPSFL